jgi:Rrf2 family protein
MKLSTKSRYGTRMMMELAQRFNGNPIQMGEIAQKQGISVKYLEQIIIPLKKAGFITSVRGPKGGHLLAKPPDEITVGEIIKVLEGEIDLAACVHDPDICNKSDTCPTRDIWGLATTAMKNELDSITLADILKKQDKSTS